MLPSLPATTGCKIHSDRALGTGQDPSLTGANAQCKLDELPRNGRPEGPGFGVRLILENSTVCQKSTRLIRKTPSMTSESFGSTSDRWINSDNLFVSK